MLNATLKTRKLSSSSWNVLVVHKINYNRKLISCINVWLDISKSDSIWQHCAYLASWDIRVHLQTTRTTIRNNLFQPLNKTVNSSSHIWVLKNESYLHNKFTLLLGGLNRANVSTWHSHVYRNVGRHTVSTNSDYDTTIKLKHNSLETEVFLVCANNLTHLHGTTFSSKLLDYLLFC